MELAQKIPVTVQETASTWPTCYVAPNRARFVLDRPSGERQPALVQPDIVLPDSPFDNRAILKALLLRIEAGEPKRLMREQTL